MQTDSNFYKTGSSTLEFIFCAPLLLVVMFVAMEINERIEHRVNTTIAAGNIAWISKADSTGQSGGEEIAKADILGSRAGAGGTLGVQPDTILPDSNTVMTYTDTKRRADAYTLIMARVRDQAGDGRAKDRAKQKIGTSTSEEFATNLAAVAIGVGQVVNSVTATSKDWLPNLFLRNLFIEEQRLSWSVSSLGTTNAAISTIQNLAESVGTGTSSELVDANSTPYRALAHRSNYLRRDPAYHPDGYDKQVLFGLAMGDDTFDQFNEQCFMNFEKQPCREKNGFYKYVENRHRVIFGIKSVMECDFTNPISAAKSVAMALIISPIESAIKSKIESAISTPVKTATDKMGKELTDLGPSMSKIKEKTDAEIAKLTQKIDQSINQAIESIGPKGH